MRRDTGALRRLNLKILEACLEPFAFWGSEHWAEFHGLRRGQIARARLDKRFPVERVEDVEGRAFSGNLKPERFVRNRQRSGRPIRVVAREHNAHILLSVDELDSALHPVALVVTDHQTGLVKLIAILPGYFDRRHEVAFHFAAEEVAVIGDVTVVGLASEIGFGISSTDEGSGFAAPLARLVEPGVLF